MARHLTRATILALMAVVAAADSAEAQPDRKFAATDLTMIDQDFLYQGEYSGLVDDPTAVNTKVRMGVQVVAHGDGQFIAVAYRGGLPGDGWDRQHRWELAGLRETGVLTLRGAPYQVAVANGWATVADMNGQLLGYLPKVTRSSPTLGQQAPPNATVIFDGTNTDLLKGGKMTDDGLLMEGTEFDVPHDFRMHLEFRLPYMPYARGQGRANSGVYLQSRYEVQVLDSFGLEGVANECGGLYKTLPPDLNMCLPPLRWQTYDLEFHAPHFDEDGKKTEPARLTVRHNGVVIHDNVAIPNKTGAGRPEAATLLPTKLQNHGNPVRFRNIWMVELPREEDDDNLAEAGVAGPPVAYGGAEYGAVWRDFDPYPPNYGYPTAEPLYWSDFRPTHWPVSNPATHSAVMAPTFATTIVGRPGLNIPYGSYYYPYYGYGYQAVYGQTVLGGQ